MIDKLIKVRKELGLKQSDVAEKLGVHQVDISKIETRIRRLDVVELADLAEIYNKPVSYFISHFKKK